MNNRYPLLYRSIQLISLLAVGLAVIFPGRLEKAEPFLAAGLILLIGIPHGATDHLIFRNLFPKNKGPRPMVLFYSGYLGLMAAYGVVWWLWPAGALGLFLLLSIYHFGQSNWNYVPWKNKQAESGIAFLWGALVLFTPILLHYEEASPIIQVLIREPVPDLSPTIRWGILGSLLAFNLLAMALLKFRGKIQKRDLKNEILNLIVLGLVFYGLPLLLGFALYFVFWHSLSSIMDQIQFFRYRLMKDHYGWKNYARNTFPFTMLAILMLAGVYLAPVLLGQSLHFGWLFAFISVVTLPHMLLMDRMYEEEVFRPAL